jgi:hypothetical protein
LDTRNARGIRFSNGKWNLGILKVAKRKENNKEQVGVQIETFN